jgi:hypothetical protein
MADTDEAPRGSSSYILDAFSAAHENKTLVVPPFLKFLYLPTFHRMVYTQFIPNLIASYHPFYYRLRPFLLRPEILPKLYFSISVNF